MATRQTRKPKAEIVEVVPSPLGMAKIAAESARVALNAVDKKDKERVVEALLVMNKAIGVLNGEERASQFAELLAEENPTMAAITRGVLVFTVLKQPTTKVPEYTFEKKSEIIDLLELARIAPQDTAVFANCKAALMTEALNRLLLAWEVEQGAGEVTKKWEKLGMTTAVQAMLGISLDDIVIAADFLPVLQEVADAFASGIAISLRDAAYWVGKYASFSSNIVGIRPSKDSSFRRAFMRLLHKTATQKNWQID